MSRRRAQAFGRVKALFFQWAAAEALLTTEGAFHDIDVKAYGSYEMGIDNDTSDIDCCVWVGRGADARLTKELFFEKFPRWLGGSAKIIAASKVPLISVVVNEIEFDICFYRETSDRDAEDGIFSRLAVETTTAILDAVPDVARFVHNVREVKQWAQDQGIYNSKLGYLGGIHIAVMVAAHHKEEGEGDYVTQFCKHYGTEWKWPTPVKLTQYYWKGPHENLVWNPVSVPAHRKHIMPVLTPVYPFSNITYATTKATFSKMMACFAARLGIEPSITTEEKQTTYRIVIAENSGGLIESRIYRLVARLEEQMFEVSLDDHSSSGGSDGGDGATRQQRWTLNVAAPEDSVAFFESAVAWWKKFVLDRCDVAVSGFASGDLSLQVTLRRQQQQCCVKK